MTGRRLPGWVGWCGLALYVGAWDLSSKTQTMSSAFAPVGHYRHGKPIYLFIWTFLTLHLMRIIPERFDPLRQLPTIRAKESA